MTQAIESAWRSPSNIALVKYWGKKSGGIQLPANASISFTLSACYSETNVALRNKEKTDGPFDIRIWLDDKEMPSFLPKIEVFFNRIESIFPWLKDFGLDIRTFNSFPHSSGIASSASSMSALSLCLYEIDAQLSGKEFVLDATSRKAISEISRLGSGSACRSLYSETGIWGFHPDYPGSADEWAVTLEGLHPVFQSFRDTILIVEQGKKAVSSSEGHDLVHHHPFASARYETAAKHMHQMKRILMEGDLHAFREIVELEAFMLHALMMSSNPWFILMKPNTLHLIEKTRSLREQTRLNMVITLDAGANIHLLYPEAESQEIDSLIASELAPYCENGMYICDRVGKGPEKR